MKGIPWQLSNSDSVLPLQGAEVQSLAGELRSHMLCGMAKKKHHHTHTKANSKTKYTTKTERIK